MAVRFRNEHTSWAVSSPITWKIEISDADHVGAVTDFEVADGARISHRADGDDVLAPILSSTASFTMMVQDTTHEALITDMAGAAEGRFTVVIYKDTVFHWAGVINSPEINIEDWYYPYPFELTAVDGLALLKNYEYKASTTSSNHWSEVYAGQAALTTIISRCLKKLPHVVTHFTGSSKFLVTAINWYNDLHDDPVTSTYDPFANTYLDNRVFADGQSGGAAKFLSCYDVLSVILRTFGARIALFDGYFLAEQIEHRAAAIGAPANYSRYYDYALTASLANTLTADQDIGGSNSIKKLRGGSYSFLPALKKVRVKQRLNALQNLIPTFNVGSDNPTTGYAVGWIKGDGLSTYVRFTATIEFAMTAVSGYPTNDSTYATFNLKIELDSLYAKRNVAFNSNGTYNLASVDWDASLSYIQIPVKVEVGATDEVWEGQTYKIDLIFRTDDTFNNGDLVVDFDLLNIRYFEGNTGGVVNPSFYTFDWVLRDAYCTIQEARTAFAPKSVTYQVSGDDDNTQELPVETIIGDKDGDIVNQWGGLLYFDNPDYSYTSTWGNRDGTRDRPIVQLLAQRLMQMQYFPRKVLRGTTVGSAMVVQVPITENSTETYILKNGVYSTHKDECAGEWVRLAFSSESVTYQAAEYETGEYQANSPSGGGGGGNPDNGGSVTGTTSTVVFPNIGQGDLLYGSAANTLVTLGKSTSATRYLSNTGTSNNPAWAQVDLTNGVTGALPFANIATINTNKLLGRYSAGTGAIQEITISTGLSLDGSGNLTSSGLGGTVTSVGVSGGTTGMTFSSSPITTSGTMTMSGTLVAANGGTGQSTYTVGDILYASGATTLTKLNSGATGTFLRSPGAASPLAWSAVTFPNSAITGDILYASAANTYTALAGVATGNALISGGVSTAPSWGKIALTTHVSGTLPVGNGGTGATTFTNNRVLTGNGTSAIVDEANLTFDGTTLSVTGKQVLATTGSYSSSQDFFLVSGTVTSTANSLTHNFFNFSATFANDGTLTGQTYAGMRFTQTTSTPTAATASYNIITQNTNTSANVSQLYGIFARVDENTTTGDLTTRVAGRFDIYKNVAATDIHTATGVQISMAENSASGRWKVANGISASVTNGKTMRANSFTLTSNRGTANTQIGFELVQNVSGAGVVVDTASGVDLYHVASSSGVFTTYYGIRSTSTPAATNTYALYFSTAGWRSFINGSLSLGVDATTARFMVRGAGATSATTTAIFENSSGTDILFVRDDGKVSIGNSSPQQTFHVTGTMRLTSSDGTATALMGRDGDGDISAVSLSGDLAINSGTLGLVGNTIISPAQITSTQDDWNPTGLSTAGVIRVDGDASFRQIRGITAPAAAKQLTLINVGSNAICLPTQNTNSTAANRFAFNRDIILFPGKSITLFYDTTSSRWRALSMADAYDDVQHLYFNECINSPVNTTFYNHWQYNSDGSDTIVAPTAGLWSGHELDTGTTTSGVGYIGGYNDFFESSTTSSEATWGYFKAVVKTPSSSSSGSDFYNMIVGFVTTIGAGTYDGIYFSYVSGAAINRITRSGGTSTSVNTGVAFTTSTVYVFECAYRPDGTAEFWINGTSVGISTTNVPLTDLLPEIIIEKVSGTNARQLTFYTLQTSIARVN